MVTKKIFQNLGVKRNKKPLQNIVYWFDKTETPDKYLCKWQYEKRLNVSNSVNIHGFVDEIFIKEILSVNQWSKFKQGENKFIIQRRINKQNI